jgi:hypothetical protein
VDGGVPLLEFSRFKQQFLNRAQRQRLGIDLDQDTAQGIYRDEAALHLEYVAWRSRTGLPLLEPPSDPGSGVVAGPGSGSGVRGAWRRWRGR